MTISESMDEQAGEGKAWVEDDREGEREEEAEEDEEGRKQDEEEEEKDKEETVAHVLSKKTSLLDMLRATDL